MISTEQAEWLYRVLFDREIDNPGIVTWMNDAFRTFSVARDALLGSEEFMLKYGAIRASHVNSSAFETQSRADLICRYMDMTERSDVVDAIDFGGHYKSGLFEAYLKRADLRLVLAGSSCDARNIAIQLALRSKSESLVMLIADMQDGCLSGEGIRSYNNGKVKIVNVHSPLEELLDRLRGDGVFLDAYVAHCEHLQVADVVGLYERLSGAGMIFGLSGFEVLEAAAAARQWDTIHVDGGVMLPRSTWPVPVHPTAGPATRPHNAEQLAVATIVKNEAAYIEDMIRSCAPICSFFLLLDTGSEDDTISIAKGTLQDVGLANDIVCSEFVDFGSARNAALSNVPDRYAWTLMLDADERISPDDYQAWGDLLDGAADAYKLPRYNYSDRARQAEPFAYPDRQGRLIRNRREAPIRYRGVVHEVIDGVDRWGLPPANLAAIGLGVGGPHIHHIGYMDVSSETIARKQALYDRLLGR